MTTFVDNNAIWSKSLVLISQENFNTSLYDIQCQILGLQMPETMFNTQSQPVVAPCGL